MTKAEEKLVKEVVDDFKSRAEARKSFDLIWQINMNFLFNLNGLATPFGV